MPAPAYRILTPRLVIRCWMPEDAPLLKAAIDSSLEHLRPWMPWAHDEPQAVEEKARRMRQWRGRFDLDQDYVYGIFNRDESQVVGGSGLHTRVGQGALEIGYWIAAAFTNQGLVTECAAALVRVGFEAHGLNRIEIHCDPANVRSAAVPRKLGFTHEATLRQRAMRQGDLGDTMIWTLFASDYPTSPAASAPVEAYDVAGARLL